MKTLIHLIVFSLLSINVHAAELEAKPVADLMKEIKATRFTYSETGMAYGFVNIKSCVYTSENMIVIKNYCSPKKEYPAKGYTIISKKFGLVEYYQEQYSDDILKRDIRIDAFPSTIAPYVKASLAKQKLPAINNFLEKMNMDRNPGCWSTNFSFYTETEDVNCYKTDITEFPAWAKETQGITNDLKAWSELIEDMEKKFPR